MAQYRAGDYHNDLRSALDSKGGWLDQVSSGGAVALKYKTFEMPHPVFFRYIIGYAI